MIALVKFVLVILLRLWYFVFEVEVMGVKCFKVRVLKRRKRSLSSQAIIARFANLAGVTGMHDYC